MNTQVSDLIQATLRKGFARVFEEQRTIASGRIYSRPALRVDGTKRSRSGALMDALRQGSYSLTSGASGVEGSIDYPFYIRFLDMKQKGNHKIYNRPLWGILYRQTFNDIRYEAGALLRSIMGETFENY